MGDDERGGAIVHAFRLIHDVQAGLPQAAEGLAALGGRARKEGWDDVERACLFGQAVVSWISGDGGAAAPLAELVGKAREADDDVMLSLGLALRSDQGFAASDGNGPSSPDADLARAIVLLEPQSGRPCERITAHTACAIALGNRWLFELSHEQYELAMAVGAAEPPGSVDFLLAPIRFNLAEAEVSWATKLYELGDERGVAARWEAWKRAAAAAGDYPMSESWQLELQALGLVLQGLTGADPAGEAMGLLSRLDGSAGNESRARGLLQLATALGAVTLSRHTADPSPAIAAIEVATEAINPSVQPFMYDLALFLGAQLEARPGSAAGLRYARHAVREMWSKRDAALATMRAQITSVRVATERDVLSRHARLDDLTGIANRRALEEFLSELIHRGVDRCALVLFDVDSFKAVNDLHGHLVGDRMLVRIAEVLTHGIRATDLAVRLGGDEFAVLLADVDTASARARAEALVHALDVTSLDDIGPGLQLRVSAGVAVGEPVAIMIIWAAADAALYQAKARGGHVVCVGRVGSA